MSLVRLNIKSRIELETRVLAAALKQSLDRGDTQGASLAHKQLFLLLKDAGKAEPGGVAAIRIADGVLPGLADPEVRPDAAIEPDLAENGDAGRGTEIAGESRARADAPDAASAPNGPDPAEESLAARLYKQPLFGDYKKEAANARDEGNTFDSIPAVPAPPSKFRQGFMRNSARLQSLGRQGDQIAAVLNGDLEPGSEEGELEPAAASEEPGVAEMPVVEPAAASEESGVAAMPVVEPAAVLEAESGSTTEAVEDSRVEPTEAVVFGADLEPANTQPPEVDTSEVAVTGSEPQHFIEHASKIVANDAEPDLTVQTSENAVVAPDTVPSLAPQLTDVVPQEQHQQSDFEPPLRIESVPGGDGPGLYGLLNVSQLAAFDEIHRNFFRQAKQILREIKANRAIRYDKLPDLQRLWVAHDILTDPVTRTDYDFRELGVRGTAEAIAHPAEEQQSARLGARTPLRIGELLQCAGLLETTELEIACDMHKAMPEAQFGTFLVRQGFIEERHLDAVLIGQKLLRAGAISVAQFQDAMEVSQTDTTSIEDALVQKGYISPHDLDLALNPPPPEEQPVLAIQIREVPIPAKTIEKRSTEMKPAMPAWKDQLDWGPPEDSPVEPSQAEPAIAECITSETHSSISVPPASKSLGGFLASQQNPAPPQISGRNAVPSWQDQIDWATTEQPVAPEVTANGELESADAVQPEGTNGGGIADLSKLSRAARPVDTLTSLPAQAAGGSPGELEIVEPSGEGVPQIRLGNAVPTWKDQLDWGSPDNEVVIVSTSENPALGSSDDELEFGIDSGSAELQDVVSRIHLPPNTVLTDAVNITDFAPADALETAAEGEGSDRGVSAGDLPLDSVTTGDFAAANETMIEAEEAVVPDIVSTAAADDQPDHCEPFDTVPPPAKPDATPMISVDTGEMPSEGGFFAHLLDKTELFEGSAPKVKALELHLSDPATPVDMPEPTGEHAVADATSETDAEATPEDDKEGEEEASSTSDSPKKDKRRRTKERRKKRR